MNAEPTHRVPLLLWPFALVWRVLGFALSLTGRILCALLGLVLMVAGVAVTMTVIGAPVGVAASVIGFLLLVRALF